MLEKISMKNYMNRPSRSKNFVRAFLAGILVPIFGILVWFFAFFERKGMTWDMLIEVFQTRSMTRTRMLALGMLFFIPLFMYYYNRNNMYGMRGVLSALMLYALIMGLMLWL